MNQQSIDMSVPCGTEGIINLRVGAIILKDGKFLMAGNRRDDYLYSVGGRIKFGETAEEAIIREVHEETGTYLEIERLGFVHENYFIGDAPEQMKEKTIYELCFYFYMWVPDDFSPVCTSGTSDGVSEYLKWVTADEKQTIYPDFFRRELLHPEPGVKHFVTDDRKKYTEGG